MKSQETKKHFHFKDYKGKYVMHCPTQESAEIFCKFLHRNNKKWTTGKSYDKHTYWNSYTSDTCYNFNLGTFSESYYYYCEKYTILEFDDFVWTGTTPLDEQYEDSPSYEKNKKTLQRNLRRLRKVHGYTQSQIAELLSIDRTTYAAYEIGKNSPSVYQIKHLAILYDVTMEAFFEEA